MPTPEHREVARVLLDKATADRAAAEVLIAAGGQADHVVGFHLQQAIEKSLKAVLVFREEEIPRSHDLAFLVERVSATGARAPDALDSIEWLTPWGVLFRYDTGESKLDRHDGASAAEAAASWAATEIDG